MFNRGCPKNADKGSANAFVIQSIDGAIKKSRELEVTKASEVEEDTKPKAPQISPTQRLVNKCNTQVIAHCELEIDSILEGLEYKPINITQLLAESQMSAKGCQFILEALYHELIDLDIVQKGEDEELCEAYNFVGKRQMNKLVKTIRDWICDVEKYRQSVQKTIIRVKKVKPGRSSKDLNTTRVVRRYR